MRTLGNRTTRFCVSTAFTPAFSPVLASRSCRWGGLETVAARDTSLALFALASCLLLLVAWPSKQTWSSKPPFVCLPPRSSFCASLLDTRIELASSLLLLFLVPQGKGSFVDAHTVAVEGEGGTKNYTAKTILIAVGPSRTHTHTYTHACTHTHTLTHTGKTTVVAVKRHVPPCAARVRLRWCSRWVLEERHLCMRHHSVQEAWHHANAIRERCGRHAQR